MSSQERDGRGGDRVLPPAAIGSHIARASTIAAPASAVRWDHGSLRDTLFLVTFLLLWLTVTPFVDLGRSDVLDVDTSGSLATMVVSLGLTAALALFMMQTGGLQALRAAARPVVVVAFRSFGALFSAHLSIHQATGFTEFGLTGDSRGTFRHENDAGGDRVIFIFGGLFATLCWVVLQPLRDLVRVRDADADLQLFFMRVWFFGLCLSSFESLLFAVGRTQWFMMTVAIFGLRLQTLSRLKR